MKEIKTILRRTRKKKIFAVSIVHWEIALVNSIVKGSFTGPIKVLFNTLNWYSAGLWDTTLFQPSDLRVD